MFSRAGGSTEIDSVVAVEGKFRFHPGVDHEPVVELSMMYLNKQTSQSFGTCPAKSDLFSRETFEALRRFLTLAEKDFGNVVLAGGQPASYAGEKPTAKAESGTGLPKGIGG